MKDVRRYPSSAQTPGACWRRRRGCTASRRAAPPPAAARRLPLHPLAPCAPLPPAHLQVNGKNPATALLDNAAALNISVLRVFATGTEPELPLQTAPGGWAPPPSPRACPALRALPRLPPPSRPAAPTRTRHHPTPTGVYNDVALKALDRVLADAAARGLRLVLILARNWGGPDARIQYASWNGLSSPDDFYASPAVRATFRDHLAFMVRGMVGVQGPMSRCAQRPGAPCLLASPSCHSAGQPHKHGQRPQVPASGAGRGRAGEQAAGSGLRLAVGDSATLATPTPQPAVGSASRHRLPPSPHHRTPCCSDDPTIFSWNLMNEPRFFANTSSNPCDTDPASCTATLQVGGGGNRGLRSCRCCLQGDCTP